PRTPPRHRRRPSPPEPTARSSSWSFDHLPRLFGGRNTDDDPTDIPKASRTNPRLRDRAGRRYSSASTSTYQVVPANGLTASRYVPGPSETRCVCSAPAVRAKKLPSAEDWPSRAHRISANARPKPPAPSLYRIRQRAGTVNAGLSSDPAPQAENTRTQWNVRDPVSRIRLPW